MHGAYEKKPLTNNQDIEWICNGYEIVHFQAIASYLHSHQTYV